MRQKVKLSVMGRALMARDKAVENWLQAQVGTAHDALKADSSRAVSVAQVRPPCCAARQTMSYRVIFAPEAVGQLAVLYIQELNIWC